LADTAELGEISRRLYLQIQASLGRRSNTTPATPSGTSLNKQDFSSRENYSHASERSACL
jgi:hypothetical protein